MPNYVMDNEPVLLLKFNDHLCDLKSGIIYLSNIESFFNNGREKIKDENEGMIELFNGERITYKEIINQYKELCQCYISSFTALYKDDFCSDGRIKTMVINNILNLEVPGEEETRGCIIYDYSKIKNLFNFNFVYPYTVEFMHKEIKKPSISDNSQEFYLFNYQNFISKIANGLVELKDKGIFHEMKYFLKSSDQNMNSIVKLALQKMGYIEKKEDFIEMTYKADKVVYEDFYKQEKTKDEILKDLSNCNNDMKIYENYLSKALFTKKSKYSTQNEYRILVTQFSREKSRFANSLKLNYSYNINSYNNSIYMVINPTNKCKTIQKQLSEFKIINL
ncbi:MAG: hypothetical protein J6573_07580 [Lactobacillus sp.]|nr:hypothetical protein [Lactobacillus sp.]